MGAAFDWIVEYETLPPDEPGAGGPPHDGRQPRRLAWWVWPTIIVLVVGAGLVALLWVLGGGSGPLPQPELEQIEAAASLEVNALQSRDAEILNQLEAQRDVHGPPLEPPAEAWLMASTDDGLAGEVTLLRSELLSPQLARAQVELVWDGIPYHLNWFYVPAGDRWERTRAPLQATDTVHQVTSVHVALAYRQPLPGGDSRFMGQLEAFIIRYCALLSCPPEPFQATLRQDPGQIGYGVTEIGPLNYLFPSLESLRWPAGGGFEPVLLGSFGRHLAYDLDVRPRLEDLPAENRSALALGSYWLAHRLLGLDMLPGTRWLEAAAQRDGTQAALVFIQALADAVPSQEALQVAFRPETVAFLSQQADYFGWLVAQQSELSPALFDRAVDPWAPDGCIFADVLPEIDHVLHGDGWVVATTPTNSGWTAVYFFRLQDGEWVPGEPGPGDDLAILNSLMSSAPYQSARSQRDDIGAITWTGIPTITVHSFELTVVPIPAEGDTHLSGQYELRIENAGTIITTDVVTLHRVQGQPSRILELSSIGANPASGDQVFFALDNYASNLAAGLADRSDILANAMLAWQVEHVLAGSGGSPDLSHWWQGIWRPPATIDSPNWRPLSCLWSAGMPPDSHERAIVLAHARLVVAYVIETEGPEALTSMIDALDRARSMAAWVTIVKGQPLAQFERAWRAWVIDSRPGS
jgi:hypothetical protein